MPDRIDAAVSRMDQVNRQQRRIESVIVVLAIVALAVFQAFSRAALVHSQAVTNKAAAIERQHLNEKLDEANRRIGQLTDALVAAGVDVPPPSAVQPAGPSSSSTTSSSVLRRIVTTTTTTIAPTTTSTTAHRPPPPQPSTTTTTQQQQPPTPPSTVICLPVVGCR